MRWCRRPVLSAVVRALVVVVSLAASMLAATVAARVLPMPSHGLLMVTWWIGILAFSTVTLLAVNRVARRLLPLASLLNLALVFPDRAPDRFRLAFRAATTRDLERRLADAAQAGGGEEAAEAAATILTLVAAMTAHDPRTRGHSERVRAFTDMIAEELRLPPHDRDRLRWAALLHDVGKLRTRAEVLNKPGPLTNEEWREVVGHPEEGARIAASLRNWLGPWAAAIEQHHERWDGSGYPKGLSGEQISLGARIVAVADAYEVMTSSRPYHRAKTTRDARQELTCTAAGCQFDPKVVRAFMNASLGRLGGVVRPFCWLAGVPLLVSGSQVAAAAAAVGRQAVATAGAATAVGVLTVSGAIHPAPAGPPPPTPVASPPTTTSPARPAAQPPAPAPVTVAPPQPERVTTSQRAASPPPTTGTAAAGQGRNGRQPSPAAAPVLRIDPADLGIGGVVPPIQVDLPPLPYPLPTIELRLRVQDLLAPVQAPSSSSGARSP